MCSYGGRSWEQWRWASGEVDVRRSRVTGLVYDTMGSPSMINGVTRLVYDMMGSPSMINGVTRLVYAAQ